MITVYSDIIIFNFDNSDRDRSLFGAGLKLHANFKAFNTLKTIARDDLLKRRIRLAIAIFWSDAHFDSVSFFFACEGRFQAWDDVLVAVQIS